MCGVNTVKVKMRPIGYLYKRVVARPSWITAPNVSDIYSLSGCVSHNFADYINYWKHNGFWLFDSPCIIKNLASEHGISLEGMKLFYYEAHEQEFDDEIQKWVTYEPEASFGTHVIEPASKMLEGFDVTSFSVRTAPECSPLSCNSCADALSTNAHCLFPTFEEATYAIESGAFEDAEPGPYRVIAVYSANEA
jgi:hypothetical protein